MKNNVAKLHPLVYEKISKLILTGDINHAYLFFGDKDYFKYETALELAKLLFCQNRKDNFPCNDCRICQDINKNEFSELKIIDPGQAQIKKDDIITLQSEFSKMSTDADKKIYIINNCDKLNKHSANSLLKFLEEPEDNIIAILITDNVYNVLDTIVSRCQKINFNNLGKIDFEEDSDIDNNDNLIYTLSGMLYKKDELKNKQAYLEEKIKTSINFIRSYEIEKKDLFSDSGLVLIKNASEKEDIEIVINIMFYFYADVLNFFYKDKVQYFNSYIDIMKTILEKNDIKHIRYVLENIFDMKQKIKYNPNTNLFFDKLFIMLERSF